MEKNWREKNVDLTELTARIGDFFKEKDFEAIKGEIPTGHQILAAGSPYFKINGYVGVTIEGKPDDFVVRLELCGEDKRPRFRSIFLAAMFGGGYFLSRRLKSEEAWMKLENEFWRYVENVILHLTDSAESFPSVFE